jgi:hypothetical protein
MCSPSLSRAFEKVATFCNVDVLPESKPPRPGNRKRGGDLLMTVAN